MIIVYFESKSHAEIMYLYEEEKEFDKDYPFIANEAKKARMKVTESVTDYNLQWIVERCNGCQFNYKSKCEWHRNSIYLIEEDVCMNSSCPINCSCDTQPNEPLHCELIPEELNQIVKSLKFNKS